MEWLIELFSGDRSGWVRKGQVWGGLYGGIEDGLDDGRDDREGLEDVG